MSDLDRLVGVHSFDPPRNRKVPTRFHGRWRGGDEVDLRLDGLNLIVAVKPQCDGCRELLESPLDEFGGVQVLFVSADEEGFGQWDPIRHPIFISPDMLYALDVRWPPFYVLIDADSTGVLTEGVVFGSAQIASEISMFLEH